MGIASLMDVVGPAFAQRYGVPAINIVNDVSMEAVLAGAVEAKSPIIVQTSVKTVRSIGSKVLYAMWTSMTDGLPVPACLHLDHCPDRAVISECLRVGWNSVLFDNHDLPVDENERQTIEVVAEARTYGAHVEGEIEGITGVEDGIGSDTPGLRQTLDVALQFIEATGIDVFAPAIGNAHGHYKKAPVLDMQRVSDIVARHPIPIALHGGSGMSREQFTELIARGCAKVNISTQLKETYMQTSLAFLRQAEEQNKWDPPSLFRAQRTALVDMVVDLATIFGSAGKAG